MIRFANLSTLPKYFCWRFIQGDSFDLEQWIKNEEMVYDTDQGGESTQFWVVMWPTITVYYKVQHAWWVDHDPEWMIINDFNITIVEPADMDKYAKENKRFVV